MDTTQVWTKVEAGEKTGTLDAWKLLKTMLEEARETGADDRVAIEEPAVTVASALDRLDQRETERETLLFELRSERGRCRELDDLLIRMLDEGAENHIASIRAALDEVDEIEVAVQACERKSERPSVEPAPSPSERDAEERNRRFALVGCSLLLIIPIALLAYKIVSEEKQRSNPIASESIEGATVEYLSPEQEAGALRMEADWARRMISASSFWGNPELALSWPDIYRDPELETSVVWTPRQENGGTEFLELGWNIATEATTIIIVEGPNAGAIVAVDEIRGLDENKLGASDYIRLWSGRMEPSASARFTLIHLPEPRVIRGIRVVLDTSLIEGMSSIDAVGLN